MTPLVQQLAKQFSIALTVLLCLTACTDKRTPKKEPFKVDRNRATTPPSVVEPLYDVQYQAPNGDLTTETLQMVRSGNGLFLTGKPFAFAEWDVASNPARPQLVFAASDRILAQDPQDSFAPMGRWLPDNYASGALTIAGKLAFMSGRFGASVVDMSDPARPIEVARHPAVDPAVTTIPEDTRYEYTALAVHPNAPYVYGFRQQDKVYTLTVLNKDIVIQGGRTMEYVAGGSLCCAMNATTFGDKIFVAFRSRLFYFTPQIDGVLGKGKSTTSMQAVNVASTARYLYVQHEPSAADPLAENQAAGVYVFDLQGNSIAYLPVVGYQFSVSPDDSHIYVNETNTGIRVYKIHWEYLL